jgi:hypothetical protein
MRSKTFPMSATTVVISPLLINFAQVLTVHLGPRSPVHHRNNPTPASIQRSRSTAQAMGAPMQPRKSSKHLEGTRPSFSHRQHEIPIRVYAQKRFALSICAFKFTVSENENVYAQISCGFIYAISLLCETISHHSSHFRVKIRALEDKKCNRYQ